MSAKPEKERVPMSAKTQAARDTMDAVRLVIGLDPLYRQEEPPPESWLSNTTDAYYDSNPRGSRESSS